MMSWKNIICCKFFNSHPANGGANSYNHLHITKLFMSFGNFVNSMFGSPKYDIFYLLKMK